MALRKTGVEWVNKGLNRFMSDVNKANKSVNSFQNGIDRMRTSTFRRSSLDSFIPSGLLDRVRSLSDMFGGLRQTTDTLQASTSGVNSVYNILNAQMSNAGRIVGPLNNTYSQLSNQLQDQNQLISSGANIWSALSGQLDGNVQSATKLGSVWSTLDASMADAAAQATGLTSKLTILAAAVTALFSGFLILGERGSAMTGIIEGFDVMARHAGTTADTLRSDLREAARGTIKDMDLMTRANIALAGTQPEVAKALGAGGGLAGLLEIARAQARATGQSVDYLYESLLLGVKRTSPRLIDNTGLVIGQTEAYEKYAQKIGKAKDELNEIDKQLAILDLTLERGKIAVETYGQGALTAAERQQRIQAKIANSLDRLAIAVQPLYTLLLQVVEVFIDLLVPAFEAAATIIYELGNAIAGPLTEGFEQLNKVASLFAPIAEQMRRWFVLLIGLIRYFGEGWRWLTRAIGEALGPIADILNKYLIEPLAKAIDPATLFKAAGFAFGAFAEGILWAFNYAIAPAIIEIANFIADFLMGQSPPPKGPLSTIDQGGYNTMLAWLDGFLGVSLTPIETMADRVNAMLGDIGLLTHEQVEARLANLDQLLEPFIANLDIARAHVERITEPLRAVQDILERKLDQSLAKFFKGDITADAVRKIDKQMEGIEDRITRASEMTDQAEVQLALAKSQQAVERALLEIQLRRTKAAEKEKEEKKKKGKAAEVEELGKVDEAEFPALGGDPVGDYLSGISDTEISDLFKELGGAFQEGVELTGFNKQLAKAKSRVGELDSAFSRFKTEPAFLTNIKASFDGIFGDGPDSIPSLINNFADKIQGAFDRLGLSLPKIDSTGLETLRITLALLVAPTIIMGVFNLATGILSLAGSLAVMVLSNFVTVTSTIIQLAAAPVVLGIRAIAAAFISMATPAVTAAMGIIQQTVAVLTGGTLVGAAASFGLIALIVIGIAEKFDDIKRSIDEMIEAIRSGDWKQAIEEVAQVLLDIPTGIAEAIANLAGMEDNEFYARLQAGVDGVKNAFLSLWLIIKLAASAIGNWLSDIAGKVEDALLYPFEWIIDQINYLIYGNSPTLNTILSGVGSAITEWLSGLLDTVKEALLLPFETAVLLIWSLLKSVDQEGSLANILFNLPANIVGWLLALGVTLEEQLLQPFIDKVGLIYDWLFNTEKEGGLANTLFNLPGQIVGWLGNLRTNLEEFLLKPFRDIINQILSLFGDIEKVIDSAINKGESATRSSEGGAAGFRQHGGPVQSNRMYVVGERGWEFFRPNVGGRIFSHAQSMRMMNQMTQLPNTAQRYQMAAAPQVFSVPGTSSADNSRHYDQRSTTQNFNVHGQQSLRLAMSQAKAWS